MFTIRKAAERGHFNHGWLDTFHTFSFADYFDPKQMGFRSLRVINEDRIAGGRGFGMHPHRDMEIVTYVLEGRLEHRDNIGHGETIEAGELQRMTAGTGLRHSEFNPSPNEAVHLYQIWLLPRAKSLKPSYEQRKFSVAEKTNRWRTVASPDGRDDSLTIQQDAILALSNLSKGHELRYAIEPTRGAWLQVMRGKVELHNQELSAGDGVAIEKETELRIKATEDAELMLFDMQ